MGGVLFINVKVGGNPVAEELTESIPSPSGRRLRFCQEYAIDHNETQAYIRAGFSKNGAGQGASRLLKNAAVRAEIARLDAKTATKCGLSAEKVLKALAVLAFFDMRKFYREDGSLKTVPELDEETQAALCGMEIERLYDHFAGGQAKEKGTLTKIKVADRGLNLERQGRHFKLFTDKLELSSGDELIRRLQSGRKRIAAE
jgi:phage terminase small subunit